MKPRTSASVLTLVRKIALTIVPRAARMRRPVPARGPAGRGVGVGAARGRRGRRWPAPAAGGRRAHPGGARSAPAAAAARRGARRRLSAARGGGSGVARRRVGRGAHRRLAAGAAHRGQQRRRAAGQAEAAERAAHLARILTLGEAQRGGHGGVGEQQRRERGARRAAPPARAVAAQRRDPLRAHPRRVGALGARDARAVAVRRARGRDDLGAAAGAQQPRAQVAVVEEQREALVERRGLQVAPRGHHAGRGRAEDRDRLARRAAVPQLRVVARGPRATAARGVQTPPDGRERPQRAPEVEVAAGEELRRAVGVVQQRRRQPDARVRRAGARAAPPRSRAP